MERPKVSLTSITQTIDLEELTGLDLSDYRGLRESIGQAILDKINARTAAGIGFGSTKLKSPYSKDYKNSLQFKASGKSPNAINMRLTGDMLETMGIDTTGDGSSLVISIDESQTPKAFNHITGDTVPKRNFFGVTKKEVTGILADFDKDLAEVRSGMRSDTESERGGKLRAIDIINGRERDDDDD